MMIPRKVYFDVAAVLTIASLTTLLSCDFGEDEYVADLAMESDAMSVVDYYVPKLIKLQSRPLEASLKLPQFRSAHPKFGGLHLGDSEDTIISIAIDAFGSDGMTDIYIDRNNNEDLTDDGDSTWDEIKRTYMYKEILVDVAYKNDGISAAVPYPISLYQFKNRPQDVVIAFRNGYREGTVTLGDTAYQLAILDDDLDGLFDELEEGAMIIDVNQDGVLNGQTDSEEYFKLSSHFNINGFSYRVKTITPSGSRIVFVPSDSLIAPKVSLREDYWAPGFNEADISGLQINLSDYRNKVVLIDCWATWCKPWESDLVGLKRNYQKYRSKGFEIIGFNLDYDLDHLRVYVEEKKITWPQIADGTGWQMPLIELYQVDALPRNFLLDRSGIIRYKNLHNKNLEAKVYELLNEPELELNR